MTRLRLSHMLLTAVLVLMITWLAVPSSVFLRPVTMSIDGRMLTSFRETPQGDVTARWHGEISILGRDGFECSADGQSFIQVADQNLARFEIGAWAWPCVDQGEPFVLRFEYSVLAFGWVPLRPVLITVTQEVPR